MKTLNFVNSITEKFNELQNKVVAGTQVNLVIKDPETGDSGGFLQVSGLTYQIDTTIPSSVVCDDKGGFVKVEGEYRVKNVMVGNDALDLNKTYKLASHNYMLKNGGDVYTMFKNDNILLDEVKVDNQVLIDYIVNSLGGEIKADSIYASPYGEGRIKVITVLKKTQKA